MGKIRYILKIFKNINFGNLFKTVNKVSEKTKRGKLLIFFDIVYCGFKYGAGYNDYLHFGFYNLDKNSRKTFITRSVNNKLVASLNLKRDIHKLDSKREFNIIYAKYLNRDWLYLDSFDSFLNFCKNKEEFIAKPDDGTGGSGIEKIKIKEHDLKDLYNYLKNNNLLLLEEVIIQTDYLNKLYPNSVNTLRIISISNKGKTEILSSFLRVGNGGIVDNTCSGGMVVPIDINTGITSHPGIDLEERIMEIHPITKEKLIGVKIKEWRACVNLVKEVSLVTPTIRYNAWDVAVTKKGPCIVEGNPYPGYYYQFPLFVGKQGYLIRAKEILKKLNLKNIL